MNLFKNLSLFIVSIINMSLAYADNDSNLFMAWFIVFCLVIQLMLDDKKK